MPTMTSESADRDLPTLIASALERPAEEGARIVALQWLVRLVQARAAWARLEHHGATADEQAQTADALHDARVALRRLRATLREHRTLLASSLRARDARVLRALHRGTGKTRDRDVHTAWLHDHRSEMPKAVRAEADRLAARLRARARRAHRCESRTFGITIDLIADPLADRLAQFALPQRVGEIPQYTPFALHLAERLERSARQLRRALRDANDAVATGRSADWHRVRLLVKRQRAMLAPFADVHPALAAYWTAATDGQNAIGALRDAVLLARRAERRHLSALAEYALDRAAEHLDLVEQWASAVDAHWQTAQAASAALHGLGAPITATAAPESSVASPVETTDDAAMRRSLPMIPDDHGLPMEIERKFLLHGLPPEAALAPSQLIEQGWLPGTLLRERLRRTLGPGGVERLTRTIKLGRPGSRIEVEEPTDPTLFAQLWPLTVRARIRKRRHLVPFGELTWEIDVFLDRDLVIAELELTDEAQAFDIPAWLQPFVIKEVTSDPAYLNSVMAQRDVPAPDRIAR